MIDGLRRGFGLLIQLVTGIIEQSGFGDLRQRRVFRPPTGEVQQVKSIGAQGPQGKLANPLNIEEGLAQATSRPRSSSTRQGEALAGADGR